MTNARRLLAVVPARGGSKGLPGKNVRPLAGLPLIGHSLKAAALVTSVTRCVVSTDSADIADVVRHLGGDVPFLRPPDLATDHTPMAPVLRHALAEVERIEGVSYGEVLLLDPTSPVRDPQRIADAVTKLRQHQSWDGVVSVSRPSFHPVWVGVRPATDGSERLERYFGRGTGVTRRQQLDTYLRINGNFYVWRAEFVRRLQSSWFDEGVHGFVEIPDVHGVSIDELAEFEALEALISHGLIRVPWLD